MLKAIVFAVLFTTAIVFAAKRVYFLARMLRFGLPYEEYKSEPFERLKKLIQVVFMQKKVVKYRYGWNHAVLFWGFLIITVGHSEFILRGLFPFISLDFLGPIYTAILFGGDVMALVVLFALCIAFYRRLVIKPFWLHYSWDGNTILGLIAMVMITYLGATSLGIRGMHPDVYAHAHSYVVSNFIAGRLSFIPVETAGGVLYEVFWWGHAMVLLVFMNVIPRSKHLHLLAAIPNVYVHKRAKPVNALARIPNLEEAEFWGVGQFNHFNWKMLLDTYACTECGRCDMHCPANRTKKPLQPQAVLHDVRQNLWINGEKLIADRKLFDLAGVPEEYAPELALIAESHDSKEDGQTSRDAIWSCTSCGACVEACPVLIDHVDHFMDMRRYLSMTEGDVSPELANTYRNLENNYNPWGIGHDKRAAWAEAAGLKFWGGSEDAEKFEYLFWVGCAGSYDARAQKTQRALSKIMDAAGVSYAVLGSGEKCSGDVLRRTGNEYQFEATAMENVETLNSFGVKKIVTACPHCMNTLKSEYSAFGGNYDVVHHSQLLIELIEAGRIELPQEFKKKVTFHDPCFLGRWNKEVEAPRKTLTSVKGLQLVEMDENKEKSFCCGAGGGQMFMEEEGERINVERTRQALKTKAEVIGVGCPFCMTMIEDGVKSENKEEEVKVLDIAEIILLAMPEAVQNGASSPAPAPALEEEAPAPQSV